MFGICDPQLKYFDEEKDCISIDSQGMAVEHLDESSIDNSSCPFTSIKGKDKSMSSL
jgi:hypothetical protein